MIGVTYRNADGFEYRIRGIEGEFVLVECVAIRGERCDDPPRSMVHTPTLVGWLTDNSITVTGAGHEHSQVTQGGPPEGGPQAPAAALE